MKSLAKGVFLLVLGGAGATLLAQPATNYSTEVVSIQTRMRADHQAVLKMKAQAEREKDIIKMNCINDQLVQMLPQMNMVDSLIARMGTSASGDQATVFADVQKGAQEVAERREAAAQCIDSKTMVGESSSSFTADGVLDDPWEELPEFGVDVVIEPPGYASPDS